MLASLLFYVSIFVIRRESYWYDYALREILHFFAISTFPFIIFLFLIGVIETKTF